MGRKALLEADAWPGPSLVIAYSTCIAHGIDMATSMSHQKDAVHSGYWPLYRFEPSDGDDAQPIRHPHKRWKLSTIDLEARSHWVDYSEAKDEMFAYTDTRESPWWVAEADDKRSARLNVMSHLLSVIPYERLPFENVKLPPRQQRAYVRPPKGDQTAVPTRYVVADRRSQAR